MDIISKVLEFNTLVERKLKAEKLFDLPTITDLDRDKWFPGLIEICNGIVEIAKELKVLGYEVKDEDFWQGIKLE